MNDIDKISAGFKLINEEAGKYISQQQLSFVAGGYDLLISSMLSEYGSENPFTKQSLDVALYLAKLGFQSEYITAALLSYPHLEKQIQNFEILTRFGKVVASILLRLQSLTMNFDGYLPWVNGLGISKKSSTKYSGSSKGFWEEKNSEQSISAFLAIAQDFETATIRVVERLFLLKNIETFPITKDVIEHLAQDTLNVFSPVAETLGMWIIKSQLEDLAFKLIQPTAYKEIALDLQERLHERRDRIDRAKNLINFHLKQENIEAKLSGRPKHLYGLYKKVVHTGKTVSEINDSLAVRIIVDDIADCYLVLNALENHFDLVEGVYEKGKKYRDWISTPKPNQYQSIHTTILLEGKFLEVQIRTQTMHDLAEYGAAAHWLYSKVGNKFEHQEKYRTYTEKIASIRRKYEQNPIHNK